MMPDSKRVKAEAVDRIRRQHNGDGLAYIARYQDEAIVELCDDLEAAERRAGELEGALEEVVMDLSGRQLPVPRETRERCERALGKRFDIRTFEWVVLEAASASRGEPEPGLEGEAESGRTEVGE